MERSVGRDKKKRPRKGEFGYIASQKRVRAVITAVLFAIPISAFLIAWAYTGKRGNIITVIAIVGILPAARSATSLIMMMRQRNASQKTFDVTESLCVPAGVVRGYELTVTAYEGEIPLEAVVVCGNSVACYARESKAKPEFMEKHIMKILNSNMFSGVKVKIFTDFPHYEERVRQICRDPAIYRQGLSYRPDEQHEGENRDEAVLRIIEDISL